MLDSMTHAQFDEWCAKDLVEPIGTPRKLTEAVARLGVMIAAINGHEVQESHFMPWNPDEEKTRDLTRAESAAAITAQLQIANAVNR